MAERSTRAGIRCSSMPWARMSSKRDSFSAGQSNSSRRWISWQICISTTQIPTSTLHTKISLQAISRKKQRKSIKGSQNIEIEYPKLLWMRKMFTNPYSRCAHLTTMTTKGAKESWCRWNMTNSRRTTCSWSGISRWSNPRKRSSSGSDCATPTKLQSIKRIRWLLII